MDIHTHFWIERARILITKPPTNVTGQPRTVTLNVTVNLSQPLVEYLGLSGSRPDLAEILQRAIDAGHLETVISDLIGEQVYARRYMRGYYDTGCIGDEPISWEEHKEQYRQRAETELRAGVEQLFGAGSRVA